MKKLWGPGDWEQVLQVLEKSDVQALNERELNAQEVFEEQQLRARLGTTVTTILQERVIVQASAVGEGLQRPSWIWFTGVAGVSAEAVNDPFTRKGMYQSLISLIHYACTDCDSYLSTSR